MRSLEIAHERFAIEGGFVIARGARTHADVVTATIGDGALTGRGECVPYARYGESVDSVCGQIERARAALELGATREAVQDLLPPGAARNAVDCALWDLDRKAAGAPLHVLAGAPRPAPVVTAFTLSLGAAEAMGAAAAKAAARPLLKVKLGGPDGDVARIAAVRAGAPRARLIVDANEGWTPDNLAENLAACRAAGVELIEQPLPAGRDSALADVSGECLLCADESLHDSTSLAQLPHWYRAVNVKLDKTGGLTDALKLVAGARARDLRIMVGCMLGSSLAMLPAVVLTPWADYVDLDAPLLLKEDRDPPIAYRDGKLIPPPGV